MSKKTSPQARSARAPRPAARPVKSVRGRSAGRSASPAAAPQAPAVMGWKGLARRFVLPILLVNVIVITVVTAVALVALLATGSTFVALPATIAQGTLIAHAAPVSSATATLGAVPLLPAVITALLVAGRVHAIVGRRITIRQVGILAAATLLIPALIVIIASLVLIDAATVLPVAAPPLGTALGRTVLLHAIAFCLGGGRRLFNALAKKCSIPPTIVGGIAVAWHSLITGVGLWIVVGIINMARHRDDLAPIWAAFPGTGARAGLIALCLGYLPNMGAVGLGLGGGGFVTIGTSVFSLSEPAQLNSPLPPLPLFAALPHEGVSWAGPAGMALLFVAALVASARAPRVATNLMGMFIELATGLVATVIGWLIITFFAAGVLGNAGVVDIYHFSPVVMILAWFAVGYLCVWWVRDFRYQRAQRAALAEQEAYAQPVRQPADRSADEATTPVAVTTDSDTTSETEAGEQDATAADATADDADAGTEDEADAATDAEAAHDADTEATDADAADAEAEAESEDTAAVDDASESATDGEADGDADSHGEDDSEGDSQSGADDEAGAESAETVKSSTDAEADAEGDAPAVDADTEADTAADNETSDQAESDAEAAAESGTEADSADKANAAAGADADADAAADADSDMEPKPGEDAGATADDRDRP